MKTINIFNMDSGKYRWEYCYLHGNAEEAIHNEDDAPDMFTADVPMPTEEGIFACSINGQPAVAVIAPRYGYLGGRIALVSDYEGLNHALTPEKWR